MLEPYRDDQAPGARAPTVKPKLKSWTGRLARWATGHQLLMLGLDASLGSSDIEEGDLRTALSAFAAEFVSFRIYLDYGAENRLPMPWAVGAFHVEHGKTFARFYDFLDTPAANALLNLLPQAGASSELVCGVVPYSIEKNRLLFAIVDYDLGFHNRIG